MIKKFFKNKYYSKGTWALIFNRSIDENLARTRAKSKILYLFILILYSPKLVKIQLSKKNKITIIKDKIRPKIAKLLKNSFVIKYSNTFLKYILPKNSLLNYKSKLFLDPRSQFMIRHLLDFKKVKQKKQFSENKWKNYKDDSNLTAIVSSFNHEYTAKHICDRLKSIEAIDQIIILEDGSSDESLKIYKENLYDVNHFILYSNDLNTLRTYDKAIKMSRSKYVMIMQDDDIIPQGSSWVMNSLELLDKIPNLGVVGGWNSIDMKVCQNINDVNNFSFESFLSDYATNTIDPTGPKYCYKFEIENNDRIDIDPRLTTPKHVPVQFTPGCDIGPLFMRREYFLESGGVDFSWGEVGKSSCWWEIDLCYRFWRSGFSVINLPMYFVKGQANVGSDQFYQSDSKKKTLETGLRKLIIEHKDVFEDISAHCKKLNSVNFDKMSS